MLDKVSHVHTRCKKRSYEQTMGENGMYTKHITHFVYEQKKSYKQKVKTECTQTIHKSTCPNIDEIEPNYGF